MMKILYVILILLLSSACWGSDVIWTSTVQFAADSGGAIEDDADTVTAKFIDTTWSGSVRVDFDIAKMVWELSPQISVGAEDSIILKLETSVDGNDPWLLTSTGVDTFIILPGTNDTMYRAVDFEVDADSLMNFARVRAIYWIDNIPATMEDTAAGNLYTQTFKMWFIPRDK